MTFEDIEDKIITEIKTRMPYVRTVETYAGQLEQNIDSLTIPFPAAFVVYGGSALKWVDGPNHNEASSFSVFVAAKNLRGQSAARKDDTAGCYKMITDVLTYLTNQSFGLGMEKLTPVKVSLLYISQTVAIYSIDFETNFDTTFNW